MQLCIDVRRQNVRRLAVGSESRLPADEELPLRDSRVDVEGKEEAMATEKRRDRPTPAEPPRRPFVGVTNVGI